MTIGGGLPFVDANGTSVYVFNQTLTSVNIGSHSASANVNDQLLGTLVSDNLGLVTGLTNFHTSLVRDGIAWQKMAEYTYAPGGVAKTGVTMSLWKYLVTAAYVSGKSVVVDTTTPSDVFAFTVVRVQNTPNLVFRGLASDGPIVAGASSNIPMTIGPTGGPTSEHLAWRADGMEIDVAPAGTATSGWFSTIDRSTGGSGMVAAVHEIIRESTAQASSNPPYTGTASTSRRGSIGLILAEVSLAPVGGPRMII